MPKIVLNGERIEVAAGMNLAAALLQAGIKHLRDSPRERAPRGAFCFMGVCQECAIFIDGRIRQACLTAVHEGMVVETRGVP